MRKLDLNPHDIETVNVIFDRRGYERLAESMKRDGWEGRPVLVEELIRQHGPQEPEYYAWTASHRIEAARRAGLATVPCLVIEMPEGDGAFVRAGYSPHRDHFTTWRECVSHSRPDLPHDDACKEGLRQAGLHAAADLMEQEIKAAKRNAGR